MDLVKNISKMSKKCNNIDSSDSQYVQKRTKQFVLKIKE